MKYTLETTINKPVNKVVELFDNVDNMHKWMKNLESFVHVSGEPGMPGAKSILKFKNGKRVMEMTETILVRDLPHEFTGTYDLNGVHNIVKNRFIANGNKTRYVTEQEFQFKGFMKVIGLLFPKAFKKESQKHLEAFKSFAESQ